MEKDKKWFIVFMVLLGICVLLGTGYAFVMTISHGWLWVLPTMIGCWGIYHLGSFLVSLSDPTNGSKR